MGQKEAIFMLENNNAVLAVVDPVYPGTALRPGSSGSEVARMQTYLNGLRDAKYPTLNRLVVDGRYGSATASTVMQYQVINRLSMDGVIGHDTWNAIVSDYNATIGGSADTYPGIPLRPGDRSQDVRHMCCFSERMRKACCKIATKRQKEKGVYNGLKSPCKRPFKVCKTTVYGCE